jgi:(1->4)-alpha-D-glucan 1-alpha-D-glucosylmutase
LENPPGLTEEQIAYRKDFVIRFQQLTGPVTAKGEEDTAFYRYFPLASLNEVGMDPNSFGIDRDTFHKRNQERLRNWPHTLLATSTHDTKRSEDVRARINVLSENPERWKEALYQWSQFNQVRKIVVENREVPDHNEEFLLYQTLVGTWPLYPMDAQARAQYIERIEKYMLKAIKEAKIHTSWINPNEAYEKAVQEFVRRILDLDPDNLFLKHFEPFVRPLMRAGIFNSLSQTLLKMTTPGVPDFYQGNELWEFNLVDPDNRRPVDYSNRRHLLAMLNQKAKEDAGALVSHLMETPEDGRIKLYLTSQVLNFRLRNGSLFQQGDYLSLEVSGEKSQHVVAFGRIFDQKAMIVVTARFFTQLTDCESNDPIGTVWENTTLSIPSHLTGNYRDVLSSLTFSVSADQALPLNQVFSKLPLAILEKI